MTCRQTAMINDKLAIRSGQRNVNRFCGCTSKMQLYHIRKRKPHRLMPSSFGISSSANLDGQIFCYPFQANYKGRHLKGQWISLWPVKQAPKPDPPSPLDNRNHHGCSRHVPCHVSSFERLMGETFRSIPHTTAGGLPTDIWSWLIDSSKAEDQECRWCLGNSPGRLGLYGAGIPFFPGESTACPGFSQLIFIFQTVNVA